MYISGTENYRTWSAVNLEIAATFAAPLLPASLAVKLHHLLLTV